jgi:D-psicose/D-tagatose/L-ribulose 3-epimerase
LKIAISSIAWTNEEESEIAQTLKDLGIQYVELAPTKIWDDPTKVGPAEAIKVVDWWADYGIKVVAFQSMLFSRPDLKIFENESTRNESQDYLSKFIELAGVMGVGRLVFGSPKNRQRSGLAISEAKNISEEYFKVLGKVAENNSTVFCIEPNAPQYACDFITNAEEGGELVRSVDSEGFGLHLDTACMALAGDSLKDSIVRSSDILCHFHVSSPMLDQVEKRDDVNHQEAADTLRSIDYQGYVSIEMRPGEAGTNKDRVKSAVEFAKSIYA